MRLSLPLAVALLAAATAPLPGHSARPITMVELPGGYFYMGSRALGEDFDEAPVHRVELTRPMRMSATEITNAQYEEIFPEHRALRGHDYGLSTGDDEAVVNVSYLDATEFCRRLSERDGRSYRLPTEAEWEYACRAGTYTQFSTGDWLPEEQQKEQRTTRDLAPVDLTVALAAPNAFGLYDMHGNVEEWCLDYYAPYPAEPLTDPAGPAEGVCRVARGGSHNTPVRFLRSANRSAMLPTDRNAQVGFRIVESDAPLQVSGQPWTAPRPCADISQEPWRWAAPSEAPLYLPPTPYVVEPPCGSGVPFYSHNHQPAVTYCDNGDLLAIWFSADAESGRELVVLSSRLRAGADAWEPASEFFRIADRNLTGSSLLNDGHGTLLHINGIAATGDWQNLALAVRRSTDNGATWTAPAIVEPEHTKRHQVIAGPSVTREGWIIQACDAGPGGADGTSLHISRDGGATWHDPWDGSPLPDFAEGATGATIAGIHAGVVQLADGALMALGRGNSIAGPDGKPRMPMSISRDMGRTWTYHASELPPIDGGQRLVLMRLAEGPLLLVSFTDHPQRTPQADRGMEFAAGDGTAATVRGYGMYAALSFDEGRTWPVRRLVSDPVPRFLDGGAWTGFFESDATHAEPRGYLAATQTPDGIIHLLSSRLHYRFNLPWLLAQTTSDGAADGPCPLRGAGNRAAP